VFVRPVILDKQFLCQIGENDHADMATIYLREERQITTPSGARDRRIRELHLMPVILDLAVPTERN
jgi:hypothetical protein